MTRRKKKPLVVINALHTNAGGGLIYLQQLLPELAADRRFRWRVVSTPLGFSRLQLPPEMDGWTAPALRFGLSHLWEQLVLPVWLHSWGASLTWSNAGYGPLLAPRAMVTIHTTPRAAAAWPGLQWKLYWTALRRLTWLCLWRAPAAFSVARHVVGDYVPGWMRRTAGKIVTAPPAADVSQAGIGRTEPGLVVTIGDFYRQKQYPLLLDALALLRQRLPAVQLVMIGRPAFAEVVDEVEQIIIEKGLTGAVEIVPGLPHGELLTRLATAAVYVNASSAECFNMPLLEAMAVGVPVVTGDYDFQREVAGEAAVYVPVGGDQAAAYAVALYGVLTNRTIANTLIKKGKERAAGFSWAATARVMTATFARVMGLTPG